MTDYQYQTILKSVKMILRGCSSIEEAEKMIDELLNKEPIGTKEDEKGA